MALLKWLGIGILGFGGYNLLSNTSNAAAFGKKVITQYDVQIDTTGKPLLWDIAGWLRFRPKVVIRAFLTNPSNITVGVQQPFVTLYASESLRQKKEVLTLSNISDKYFSIPPNQRVAFEPIVMEIPLSRLLTQLGTSLQQALISKQPLSLIVEKQTRIQGIPAPIVETEVYKFKL